MFDEQRAFTRNPPFLKCFNLEAEKVGGLFLAQERIKIFPITGRVLLCLFHFLPHRLIAMGRLQENRGGK